MSRIGILGGTFNPIHKGHIQLAGYCKEQLCFEKVLLVPDYIPPHKSGSALVSSEHRLNMCRLAIKKHEDFEISEIEINRQGKSYTFETLSSLKELYPDDELVFITGADMFMTLHSWRQSEVIFQKASIATAPRNEIGKVELEKYYNDIIKPMGAKAYILENPVIQVSSTYVRENIYSDKNICSLIDSDVYRYIAENNLYRK